MPNAKANRKQLLKVLEAAPSIEAFFHDLEAMLGEVCLNADVTCPEGFAALERAREAFSKFDE